MEITHYKLDDGRFWDVANAVFVEAAPEGAVVCPCPDEQGNNSLEGLIGCLKFYGFPMGELMPPEDIQAMLTNAIQERLDAFAQTRGYDNIMSACTYATSAMPQFRAEGERAVALRDNTWAVCYAILEAVLAGKRAVPTLEELFAELPALEWEDTDVAALLQGKYSQ